jgi:hypothetical protein
MVEEQRERHARAGRISAVMRGCSVKQLHTEQQRERAAAELERILDDRNATPEQLRAAGAKLDG